MPEPKVISKPLGYRLLEFLQSIQVVRDCLAAIRQGKSYAVIPLYGQLRALLAEKSKQNKPLLLELASLLGETPRLHAFPGVDRDDFPEELASALVLRVGGLPVSFQREHAKQSEVDLPTFLAQKMVLHRDRYYTRAEIIKLLAEKSGGAHFPQKIPEDFAQILSVSINGQPALANALVQMAAAVFDLSVHFIRGLCNFEIHVAIAVPPQKLESPGVVFDGTYPGTQMRFYLAFSTELKPIFGVVGLDGYHAEVGSAVLPNWSSPRHLALVLAVGDDLNSYLAMRCDDAEIARLSLDRPLFVAADLGRYEQVFNRAHDNGSAQMRFGLINHLMIKTSANLKGVCALRSYMENACKDPAAQCAVFSPGASGHRVAGTGTIQMQGEVKMELASAILGSQ